MKVVDPSVKLFEPIDGDKILKHLEKCARTCYRSEDKICDGSAEKLITNIIKNGHLAVLDHSSISVKFVCDRACANEITRHRLAAYCQESTRYCAYNKDKFGKEIALIKPSFLDVSIPSGSYNFKQGKDGSFNWYCDGKKLDIGSNTATDRWLHFMSTAEQTYMNLIEQDKWTPQEARSVLPNSLRTELVMTADLREWRHFLTVRSSTAAHPQIRELSIKLLRILQETVPIVFDDIDV